MGGEANAHDNTTGNNPHTCRNLINARLSPILMYIQGTEKMETTSKIYRVSNPAWGGMRSFIQLVCCSNQDLFISCQQSHVRVLISAWTEVWRRRVGGWADGAQGCGLRSFSAPKVRLCFGLQQQPPEVAHAAQDPLDNSRMAKRSRPACLFFDSKSSQHWSP